MLQNRSEVTTGQKISIFRNTLHNTVNNIKNDWTSKERENLIFEKMISLEFVKDGQFIMENKECVKKIKTIYNSKSPSKFSTKTLLEYFDCKQIDLNLVYVIKEPFGSKASPDFLLISIKGILGIEDKSSKNGKITFNTGTPGGNKFIMYFDRKIKKVFLISGERWNWGTSEEEEYKKFIKEMIEDGHKKFSEKFAGRAKNFSYYARPMLLDGNNIKDICDPEEKDVIKLLNNIF